MPSPEPFRRLRDLDRSSPKFPDQLTDILLGEDGVNLVQNLPYEDLGPFVEYLDSVRLWVAVTCSLLNIVVGSQRPRPYLPCLLSLLIRTPEDLWCPQGSTSITHTLRRFSEHRRATNRLWNFDRYAQGDPQSLAGLCEKVSGVFHRRSTKIEGVIFAPFSNRRRLSKAPSRCSTRRLSCGNAWTTQTSFPCVELPSTLLSSSRTGCRPVIYRNISKGVQTRIYSVLCVSFSPRW